MTPTPEEAAAHLRSHAESQELTAQEFGEMDAQIEAAIFAESSEKSQAIADLIERQASELSAQAEALRQMREALEAQHAQHDYSCDYEECGSWLVVDPKCTCGNEALQTATTAALALPITEAEKQARENAEKAGLLDASIDALRGLYQSADARWMDGKEGHDWAAAMSVARGVLTQYVKAAKEASNVK